MQIRALAQLIAFLCLTVCLSGCSSTGLEESPRLSGQVDYAGSSTVAVFLREAQPVYGAIDFDIDTSGESLGGERMVREGSVDLAGIAREPEEATMRAGVNTSLIGRDAIAVIVNAQNPIDDLPLTSLDDLFTGRVKNWAEIGGPDLPVQAFIVGKTSATRAVFRSAVLGSEDYANCEVVTPDTAIIDKVASSPGAIGQLSFSLLKGTKRVRAIAVDSQRPDVANFDYPIARPLYLLWNGKAPVIEAFVHWTQGDEGQRVVMENFVGNRVLGSAAPEPKALPKGTLIVRTEKLSIAGEEGIFTYHPYSPYEILSRNGDSLLRVRNHAGNTDNSPTRVSIAPGTYLIRSRIEGGKDAEFLATVASGQVTEVDINDFVGSN